MQIELFVSVVSNAYALLQELKSVEENYAFLKMLKAEMENPGFQKPWLHRAVY